MTYGEPTSGWECPKCHHVYAPSVQECSRCIPQAAMSIPFVQITPLCTCGTTARCILHQPLRISVTSGGCYVWPLTVGS